MVLQYSDDFLVASTNDYAKELFKDAISNRFSIEWRDKADWYLQARITQDRDRNITLDQRRYALSIVQQYIPNQPPQPSPKDIRKFAHPLPRTFVWTRKDCSADAEQVAKLEFEYGFKMRAIIGSLNYLANTAYEELYAIRKACKYMHFPGRNHFVAVLHLLHHIRCHPPKAIKFYHDATEAPTSKLFDYAKLDRVNVHFFGMSDSAFQDAEDMKSTGCNMCILQGGIVEMGTFVPEPIAMSSAEAEINALTVTIMKLLHVKYIVCELLFGDPCYSFTVPILTDSKYAKDTATADKETKQTKHIERRWLYVKYAWQSTRISLYHISKDYQLADMGTKNVTGDDAQKKLSCMEVTSPDLLKHPPMETIDYQSKEG
jgi:hypothetical protein